MPDSASPPTISVCIVCRNEATKLRTCLESTTWADEVIVMDLQSADDSAAVARELGATVVSRAPHPIVEPLRNELAAHASGTWILAVDPDESVTPGLAIALRSHAARNDIDAVIVPRTNIDFGWAPESPLQRFEPQLRMYRRAVVEWPEFPNSLPKVPEERIARLPSRDDLVLEHRRNVSVAETADRLVRYAPAEAQAMIDRGQEFSAAEMFHELRRTAYRHFISARAWEEGLPGLVRATVLVNHKVYVWIAFWQLSGAPRTPDDDREVARVGRLLRAVDLARRTKHLARRPRRRGR